MEISFRMCPQCRTRLQREDSAFELARKSTGNPDQPPGLSVVVYVCPKCGLTELYTLKVLGSV